MAASLYSIQSKNVRKTWLLMIIFTAFVVAVAWAFNMYYGQPLFLYFGVALSISMSFISYWKSDKIALSIAGAKPAKKEEYYDLYTMTENLAITAGLPMPGLYVIADSAPNAFATGRDPKHGVVAVTQGLLDMLDKSELEGVIAHELAHIKNRDTLLQTAVIVLVGLLSLLADWFLHFGLFGGGDRDSKASGPLAIIGIVLIILSPIVATIIQLSISRRREYLADASGALLTRYPEGLANALLKIEGSHKDTQKAHSATAHLYFSNPFKSRKKQGFLKGLFQTHPPTEKRIANLRGIKVEDN